MTDWPGFYLASRRKVERFLSGQPNARLRDIHKATGLSKTLIRRILQDIQGDTRAQDDYRDTDPWTPHFG